MTIIQNNEKEFHEKKIKNKNDKKYIIICYLETKSVHFRGLS